MYINFYIVFFWKKRATFYEKTYRTCLYNKLIDELNSNYFKLPYCFCPKQTKKARGWVF